MIPTVFTTAFIYFDKHQRVIAAATIGAIASLAPTLGPTVGGWITDNYSWHWLFFVNLVPGLFVAIVVPILVRVDKPNLALLRGADYAGMVLMGVSLGCLEYTLEEGPRWDWFGDGTIRTTAWIAALSAAAFIWRSLVHPNPVVDLRALKSRNFSLGCFFSFVTGIGIFATIYLTPLFLARVRGFSALQIGEAVFSTGIFSDLRHPHLYLLRQAHRPALADDVRLELVRDEHVELRAHYARVGLARTAAAAGAARLRPTVRRGADGDIDAGEPRA